MLDTHGGNVERDEVFAVFPRNVTTSIQHNHVLDINRMSVQNNEVFMVGQMIFVYIMSSNFTPIYDLKLSVSFDPSPWKTISEIQAVKVNNFTYLANVSITLAGSFKIYVSLYRHIITAGDLIFMKTGKPLIHLFTGYSYKLN